MYTCLDSLDSWCPGEDVQCDLGHLTGQRIDRWTKYETDGWEKGEREGRRRFLFCVCFLIPFLDGDRQGSRKGRGKQAHSLSSLMFSLFFLNSVDGSKMRLMAAPAAVVMGGWVGFMAVSRQRKRERNVCRVKEERERNVCRPTQRDARVRDSS